MQERGRLAVLGVLLTLIGAALGCGRREPVVAPAEVFPAGLDSYNVQMHVHGHSHHNGDPKPGSMQWHSHFADQTGSNVLWWSDHSEMFDLRSSLSIDLARPASSGPPDQRELRQAGHAGDVGGALAIELTDAPEEDVEWIRRQHDKIPGRVSLVARSRPDSRAYSEVSYMVKGPKGLPRGFLLPRPISSGAVLALDLRAWATGPDALLEVQVGLSWHHRGEARRHVLRYRLSSEVTPPSRSVPTEGTVLVTVPVGGERQKVLLDLQNDASLLEDGEDNTITSIEIRLSARQGSRATVEIFGLELSSTRPEPEHQLAEIRRFASAYEQEYGHAQHVGVEFLSEAAKTVHLNAFLPDAALTGSLASGDEATWRDPSEFVRRVQSAGGVVSFNHMFGTRVGSAKPPWQATLSRRKVAELVRNRAYGADLLEVGYTDRGGVGLEYHLRTWDALTASGVFLYGNGVSDTHGSEWGPSMRPNRFATWIWSEGVTSEQLIAATRKGRMVFGDPFAYAGRFYFRIGEAEMGDRVRVRKTPQMLRIGVDEQFDLRKHKVLLVQGRIRPENPAELYFDQGADGDHRREVRPDREITVDVSQPCFVRLEIHDRDGNPLRFTNPIVFERRKRLAS